MKGFLKYFIFFGGLLAITYNSVDAPMRAKFDDGLEEQIISLVEWRENAYLFWWEFFGAHEDELKRQRVHNHDKNYKRRKDLAKRREINERGPAYVPKTDYEKFMSK